MGFVRDARGEIPPEQPLHDVVYDAVTDTLSFWYGSDTRYLFKYRPSCSELVGLARLFVTDTYVGLLRPDTVPRAELITAP